MGLQGVDPLWDRNRMNAARKAKIPAGGYTWRIHCLYRPGEGRPGQVEGNRCSIEIPVGITKYAADGTADDTAAAAALPIFVKPAAICFSEGPLESYLKPAKPELLILLNFVSFDTGPTTRSGVDTPWERRNFKYARSPAIPGQGHRMLYDKHPDLNCWLVRMTAPFKVLIIGGGIAGLALAIMLEAYGFDYELLEKHSDVAPKLGAGVGLTPNGARILDQIGVWDSMTQHGSPVNAGAALSPDGGTVIFNPNMGEWLEKLFGYKIHFLSRHDCLRILFNKIQRKSNIHLLKEVVRVELVDGKAHVQTTDGAVFTGDLVVGADGVRSNVRRELWRIADAQKPGYIPKHDRSSIISIYTAVVGIAHNSGLPQGGSLRAYNEQRSYFFQEGREGSGELYWWLCAKNPKTETGIIPKLGSEVKQSLVEKYATDQIGPDLTLGDLYRRSIYSAAIPLQEFVLEKCHFKNILLIGDSFRKLHPVAGQGANSAIEESAFIADLLWELRRQGALQDPARVEKALAEFERERFVRLTALREEANLVQRMESFDNPVLKFMALHVIPRLNFVVAFLPQLGSSFTPGRSLKGLPAPKAGYCPFLPDIQARPRPRPLFATLAWISLLAFVASLSWWMSRLFPSNLLDGGMNQSIGGAPGVIQIYTSLIAVSISGLWVIESYKAPFLISPLTSAVPWILASNHWGWEIILPIYIALHIGLSRTVAYYHMPQTMTDLAAAKALVLSLILVYSIPMALSVTSTHNNVLDSWKIAHLCLPLVTFLTSKLLRAISSIPNGIEAVFSTGDLPHQRTFFVTIRFIASAAHLALALKFGARIFAQGTGLLSLPIVHVLLPLTAATTSWCLYYTWDLARIKALDTPVSHTLGYILVSTVLCGPAATLASTYSWGSIQLAKATSFSKRDDSTAKRIRKRSLTNITRLNE
ncbi:FAD-dependent oxidoreductase [Aspergillus affinis]|uniref:FAD-dependent oxidoreductase n=1 Tax=Aspergillus affinis TaxID=1070780 RepID=UPI0022FF1D2C|nr:FAD-dependent monooxygenase NtnA [Aspergillus affinis]KAI9037695.1 FAD-dependent monooxygenase NtnA [Aspergillus affinis]